MFEFKDGIYYRAMWFAHRDSGHDVVAALYRDETGKWCNRFRVRSTNPDGSETRNWYDAGMKPEWTPEDMFQATDRVYSDLRYAGLEVDRVDLESDSEDACTEKLLTRPWFHIVCSAEGSDANN
jgi:hypothetical protein